MAVAVVDRGAVAVGEIASGGEDRAVTPGGVPGREDSMVERRTVAIGSDSGLHARPAAVFVKAAAAAPAPVTIRVGDGKPVPARSMLSVLSLGARKGTEVTLEADGEQAAQAVDELAALLARNLDADE
jgi:phosphocarrier protein HPr